MISSSKKITPVYYSDQFEEFSCVDSVAAHNDWTALIQVQYSLASDNGPSEKTTSLQRTSVMLRIGFSMIVVLRQSLRSGRFSFPDSDKSPALNVTFQYKFASK